MVLDSNCDIVLIRTYIADCDNKFWHIFWLDAIWQLHFVLYAVWESREL